MTNKRYFDAFFISLVFGVLLWLLIYWIIPVKPVNQLSSDTIFFIVLSYAAMIIGYSIVPKISHIRPVKKPTSLFIWLTIALVVVGFVFRYIDLFAHRELSFYNSIHINRKLADDTTHSAFFLLTALPKYLFFAPLILTLFIKSKDKTILFISSLLFLLPLLEAYLRGSRGPFLVSFSLILLILLYFDKLKFNKKTLLFILVSVIVLVGISSLILTKREGEKNEKDVYKSLLTEAKYNDLLAPKESFYQWYDLLDQKTLKIAAVNLIHIGQYYTHGVFEFNHLMQQPESPKQHGKYTFFILPKLLNFLKITSYDLSKITEVNPRGYTFIGLLGGLYLDWGWYTIIVLLVFGAFQNLLHQLSQNGHYAFVPLYSYFLFGNFFMLTFNFYKGNGTTILIVCFIFALINYIPKNLFRKEK